MRSSAGTLSWTADKDYVFVGARATAGGNSCVTSDPGQTSAEATTPTSNRVTNEIIWATITSNQANNIPISFPVPKGTTLFVSCSVANNVMVFLDDVVSAG